MIDVQVIQRAVEGIIHSQISAPLIAPFEQFDAILAKKKGLLQVAKERTTPCYVVDGEAIETTCRDFQRAFADQKLYSRHFFALKSNDCLPVVRRILDSGIHADVSSNRELDIALAAGAQHILYTGPGKSDAEFDSILEHADKIITHVDSIQELRRLGALATTRGVDLRIGMRVYAELHGRWQKFGIPLELLREAWTIAAQYPRLKLEGIQTHMSGNKDPNQYYELMRLIGHYLVEAFSAEELNDIKFLDVGGGFLAATSYWYRGEQTPLGRLVSLLNENGAEKIAIPNIQHPFIAPSVAAYAERIAAGYREFILPHFECEIFTEPGRALSHDSLIILLQLVDKKNERFGIVDGGICMVGWERFESRSYPILSLTHPSKDEHAFELFGPMCTPHDTWGKNVYATTINQGDYFAVLNQGDYTYSLAHDWIKAIPPVYELPIALV